VGGWGWGGVVGVVWVGGGGGSGVVWGWVAAGGLDEVGLVPAHLDVRQRKEGARGRVLAPGNEQAAAGGAEAGELEHHAWG
jgi:hypothetical protein